MQYEYVLSENTKQYIKALQDYIFEIKKQYLLGQNTTTLNLPESELRKRIMSDERIISAKKEIIDIYKTCPTRIIMSKQEYEDYVLNK